MKPNPLFPLPQHLPIVRNTCQFCLGGGYCDLPGAAERAAVKRFDHQSICTILLPWLNSCSDLTGGLWLAGPNPPPTFRTLPV